MPVTKDGYDGHQLSKDEGGTLMIDKNEGRIVRETLKDDRSEEKGL